MITAQPHSIIQSFNRIYKPMFTTQARYIDIWGGRGRGGSHTASDYALHLITQPHYFRGYFVRQVFGDIRDSLFRDFKDRIANNETINIEDFNIQENEMRVLYKPTGNLIISKGVKAEGGRTAKMKSLAGATHVFIEEADEIGEDDFSQMDDSLRTTKAAIKIIRIFNPPSKDNWWWARHYDITESEVPGYFKATPKQDHNFYILKKPDGREEVFGQKEKLYEKYPEIPEAFRLQIVPQLLSIFSTYNDNIKNIDASTQFNYENYKTTKPRYYYPIIKGLISEGLVGRVYAGWKPITNDEFNSIDARSIFGQDFGKSSPAALVEIKIVNTRLYVREQNYKPATEKELALMYCRLGIINQPVIADSAEPMAIVKLRSGLSKDELSIDEIEKHPQLMKGFNIFGVSKAPGSVNFGIGLVQDYEVFVTSDSTNIWEEFREYVWAKDRNKVPTDEPEDHHNHACDAIRYVVMSKGKFF